MIPKPTAPSLETLPTKQNTSVQLTKEMNVSIP